MVVLSLDTIKQLLLSNDFDLRPTQKKLCLPILKRIYHKMKLGVTFNSIHTANGLLIEGHHRYICSLLLQKAIDKNEWQRSSIVLVYKWQDMEIDENDWEIPEIIERHNAKDAAKSGMDISILRV